MKTTVGQVIINDMLPEDMRDYSRVWDKKTKGKVLTELVKRHPDQIKDVLFNLMRFGAKAAYETGGQSHSIGDAKPLKASYEFQKYMKKEMQNILERAYRQGKDSDDPDVQKAIVAAARPWAGKLDDAIKVEMGEDNPLYRQAFGTGAQKPGTLRSIVGGDVFYVDQNNKLIPIPVTHGYAQGLTPAEYFIQSFGTRKGVVDLQKATQDSGFLSKQLVQIAHRLVVTDDDDKEHPYDPANPIGYPVETDDADNEGSYLAQDIAGYKRNTLLTPKILADIKSKGHDNILIRSVIAGGPSNGGVYGYDCGIREKGRMPTQGDFVGINAVQAISEPLTQGAISCLLPETLVRMADGSIKFLKDLKVGDKVLGSDINGRTSPAAVTFIFDQGVQPVYTIKYRRAYKEPYEYGKHDDVELRATLEHKVLTRLPDSKTNKIQPCGETDDNVVVFNYGTLPHLCRKIGTSFFDNIRTMDIEIDNESHLFVLANGLIVSNSKHSGGVAGADSGKAISGFKYINQLIQVPKHFQGGAVHSTVDGIVDRIENAPQGGKYIYVSGQKHYVGVGQEGQIPIKVKLGDRIEAGDTMTEGIPNPSEIVKYKGLGEGRRYFTNTFRDAMNNAGTPVNRRNIEALSKGLLGYVKLTDEMGDYSVDDIVPYVAIANDWKPRTGAVMGSPKSLVGSYLEKPVLHYTIGTKIRPSMVKTLQTYGVNQVCANKEPLPFESEMVRGMAHVSKDPDWGTRLLGAYNKDSLLEGARLGASSNTQGTSYVPAIAFGGSAFGHEGATKQGSAMDNFIDQLMKALE